MNKLFIVIIAAIAAASGGFAYKYYQAKQAEAAKLELALLYPQERLLTEFSLTDHKGERFGKQQLRDKWTLLFFGYTSCPDICPTTLLELNYVYPKLQEITNNNVQIILVTADPKRDSQEKLNAYINYFNKDFIALRGGHDKLFPFARNLGLMYAITENTDQEYYLVNHSASIVLTNPNGNIQAIFKPVPQTDPGSVPSIDAEIMAKDFAKIYQQVAG